QKQKKLIMLPSETMIWQPEFTDKTLSRKPGAVHCWSNLQLMVRIVPAIVEIVIFSSGKNGNRFSLVSFTNHNLWGILQYQKKPVPQK
ncbi:hypothetical protein ACRWYW_19730, partial [Escherichia coli]